jgi:hypothetical protein
MPKIDQCAKCGSDSVVHRAIVVDKVAAMGGEQNFTVRVDADPTAVKFKKSTRSDVHAWFSGQCVYIELYADNPAELFQAFTAAQSTLLDLR